MNKGGYLLCLVSVFEKDRPLVLEGGSVCKELAHIPDSGSRKRQKIGLLQSKSFAAESAGRLFSLSPYG
jgi:hypothetical protein